MTKNTISIQQNATHSYWSPPSYREVQTRRRAARRTERPPGGSRDGGRRADDSRHFRPLTSCSLGSPCSGHSSSEVQTERFERSDFKYLQFRRCTYLQKFNTLVLSLEVLSAFLFFPDKLTIIANYMHLKRDSNMKTVAIHRNF